LDVNWSSLSKVPHDLANVLLMMPIPETKGTTMSNIADQLLDADTATRSILGLIPVAEQARGAAIADADPALVKIGLGQLLTDWLSRNEGQGAPMQDAVRCSADEDVDTIVQAYWQWLRKSVPTVH
jgi:hypothetical protein